MLVQKVRLQRGWSQQQLADLSGLSVRTIQRIERGQGASVETLKSLAAVFETDFSNLQNQPESGMPPSSLPHGVSLEEKLAFDHVRKVKGFYVHVLQYLFTLLVLGALNLYFTPHKPWVIWVALGWGHWCGEPRPACV